MEEKLSELIREGAKKRPQGFGEYISMNKKGQLCTCAFGAAMEAAGVNLTEWDIRPGKLNPSFHKFIEGMGILEKKIGYDASSKSFDGGWDTILDVVSKLNDDEKRTREEIANILEAVGY